MRKAREAAVNKNQADEDRWLGEAKAGGVSASDLATFQREPWLRARRQRR